MSVFNSLDQLVLFVDENLLVVDKPAGLPTLIDGYNPDAPFLVGLLKRTYDPLWVVHRLDRPTSGVMIFARTAEAHRSLNTQFEKRLAIKIYHALINGDPPWEEQDVQLPLRADGDRKHRTVIDRRRGKSAHTQLRVLEHFGDYALVEATLHTGRTHQIRAHLSALGHALVADALYGGAAGESFPIQRVGLHAFALSFFHPVGETALRFEAPYPPDFAQTVQKLRQNVK